MLNLEKIKPFSGDLLFEEKVREIETTLFFEKLLLIQKNQKIDVDDYVLKVLKIINFKLFHEIADKAFESFGDLLSICRDIFSGENKMGNHEFYPTAKKYIGSYLAKFKEKETSINYYCTILFDKFAAFAAKKYIEKFLNEINESEGFNFEEIPELNKIIMDKFLPSSITDIFYRSMLNNLIYCLTYTDKKSRRTILQLVLDSYS